MLIRVTSVPQPWVREPDYVKAAYVGLVLQATALIPAGMWSMFPLGWYQVPVGHFIKQMKDHDREAYEWHASQWGAMSEELEETRCRIDIPFPIDCCTECSDETIQ